MTNALAPYFPVGLKRLSDTSLLIGKVGKGKAKSVTVPRKCLKNSKLCLHRNKTVWNKRFLR